MNRFFILFSNCVPVKGATRSLICDLQNSTFEFIPNELYQILKNDLNLTLGEILANYPSKDRDTIIDYFRFLQDRGFGFWNEVPIPELTPLDLQWDAPAQITNAIIDINKDSCLPFNKISEQLDALNCISLELRFYSKMSLNKVENVLSFFDKSTLKSITILIQHDSSINVKALEDFAKGNSRIMTINISNSGKDDMFSIFDNSVMVNCLSRKITSHTCCGLIKPSLFDLNLEMFTESQGFNSCLNRKIAIDVTGNIKNCPSLPNSFGNISSSSLENVLNHKNFKLKWGITKDQIETCKVCEFRYMCTDCRAYIDKKKGDGLGKPLKCSYDPYAAKWA